MSRTDPPCASADSPGQAEEQAAEQQSSKHPTVQQQREALIVPLTGKLQAIWSKKTLNLAPDEIYLLQLMSTLVRLSDLDVLQTLPIANKIMPPSDWNS